MIPIKMIQMAILGDQTMAKFAGKDGESLSLELSSKAPRTSSCFESQVSKLWIAMESTHSGCFDVLCALKPKKNEKMPNNGQIGILPSNSHNPTLAKNKDTRDTPVLDQIQFGFQVSTCQWKANGLTTKSD
jgi:hypothetical protein